MSEESMQLEAIRAILADDATKQNTGNSTLADILAKLIANPATETSAAAALALTGAQRNATAPNVTTAAQRLLEAARDGSLRVSADLYDHVHQTHLVAAGAFVRTPLAVPCDGLRVDFDGAVVYGQPRGRPYHVTDGLTFTDAAKWSGANWTVAGAKATHTAGAVEALAATTSVDRPIVVGNRYAVVMKISGRTAGSVTAYLGTQAGAARAADGTFIEVLAVAGNTTITVVPTNDFDGAIELLQVYPRTPKLCAYVYEPFAMTEVVGVASGGTLGTLLAASAIVEVHACYRRVPGAADLG